MKFKIIFVALFLVFITSYSYGQTANDFEKKYGSEKFYKMRSHTLVLPMFDKDNRVCQAMIKPYTDSLLGDKINTNPRSNSPMFMTTVLNSRELKEVFDELIPIETRRGKGISTVDFSGFGARYTTTFKFENITIKAVTVPYEKAVYDMEAIGGNLDLFLKPAYGAIESANIVWTERTCVEN